MIKVLDKGVLVEGDVGGESVKLLWDLLSVVGMRFAVLAELKDEEVDFDFPGKYQLIKWKGREVLLFNCSSEMDFNKILAVLSDSCISDFYITVNTYFENILNKINSADMFSEKSFLIDDYLNEFPRTLHVQEDKFLIDFDMFKEYTYQLQRVAKRYMK